MVRHKDRRNVNAYELNKHQKENPDSRAAPRSGCNRGLRAPLSPPVFPQLSDSLLVRRLPVPERCTCTATPHPCHALPLLKLSPSFLRGVGLPLPPSMKEASTEMISLSLR